MLILDNDDLTFEQLIGPFALWNNKNLKKFNSDTDELKIQLAIRGAVDSYDR